MRTSGVNVHGAAEYVIAVAPSCRATPRRGSTRTSEPDAGRRRGSEWAGRISSLSGKTIGIVGLGAIGRETARLALAHGMPVLASDPFVDPAVAAARSASSSTSLERLLAEADVVTVHVVLDESTHHLFGAEQFEAMKPTALFVNAARGGVVDTAALVDALRSGAIAHAVVDVLEEEPPGRTTRCSSWRTARSPPHLGGCTDHGYDEIGALAAELIELYLSGAELPAVLRRRRSGPADVIKRVSMVRRRSDLTARRVRRLLARPARRDRAARCPARSATSSTSRTIPPQPGGTGSPRSGSSRVDAADAAFASEPFASRIRADRPKFVGEQVIFFVDETTVIEPPR